MFSTQNNYLQKRSQNIYTINYKSLALLGLECQICGRCKNVDCHHIDGNRKNNPKDGSNWLRVCRRCHHSLHNKIRDSRGRFAGSGKLIPPHILMARLRMQLTFRF